MGWKDFVEWWKCLVYGPELDLALIGLQNAGKTSFARVLARGDERRVVCRDAPRHDAPCAPSLSNFRLQGTESHAFDIGFASE